MDTKLKSVEDYIACYPKDTQKVLKQIRILKGFEANKNPCEEGGTKS